MKQKVIVQIVGGLGNQMFCYACGYAVAHENNCDLYIDTTQQDNDKFRPTEITKFNIGFNKRITIKKGNSFIDRLFLNKYKLYRKIGIKTKVFNEKVEYQFDKTVFQIRGKSVYLKGYWQSYKYFDKYREDILRMFTISEKANRNVEKELSKIEKCENSIAIHIRRGDYVNIGCTIDERYYKKAIKFMEETLNGRTEYFIFTDDLEYGYEFMHQYMDLNMHVLDAKTEDKTIYDMYLMSKCQNQIIANSSYSWWAAWLNTYERKVVVCPEVEKWRGDFYPEEWVKIDSQILEHKYDEVR